MHHDDLHGLRRTRDPHAPKPWTPEPGWGLLDWIFALALAVAALALVGLVLFGSL